MESTAPANEVLRGIGRFGSNLRVRNADLSHDFFFVSDNQIQDGRRLQFGAFENRHFLPNRRVGESVR